MLVNPTPTCIAHAWFTTLQAVTNVVSWFNSHTLLVSPRCGAESLGISESLIMFDCPPVVPDGSGCVAVVFSVSLGSRSRWLGA